MSGNRAKKLRFGFEKTLPQEIEYGSAEYKRLWRKFKKDWYYL
jgi:hypothetical protein